jgi:HD-like signal output (HDOD) protein
MTIPTSDSTAALFARLKAAKRLPSPPGAALRVLEFCRREDVDLQEIADVIMSDPVLAGRLLRFANSPMAGIARQVVSIREALLLLGLRTVKLTALGFSLASPEAETGCPPGFDLKKFWADSFLRAVIARRLAAEFRKMDREEAFTAALLSGLGQLALARGLGEEYARILNGVTETRPLLMTEREVLGSDHVQIGAMLLREWGLPEVLIQAVESQNAEFEADKATTPSQRLTQVVYLAKRMAPFFVGVHQGVFQLSDVARKLVENVLGLSESAWVRISAEIFDNYRDVAALFNVELDGPTSAMDLYAEAQEEATRVGMVAQLERTQAIRQSETLLILPRAVNVEQCPGHAAA